MKHKRLFQTADGVPMDDNHIALIKSLVTCSKPMAILELGIGSGAVTSALLEAMAYNRNGVTLTCVDNFTDWGGDAPDGMKDLPVNLVVQSEREFVASCRDRFDFIVSDADHDRSNEWIAGTLALLSEGGIAVFHDVSNPDYPNLLSIIQHVKSNGMSHVVFNKSSIPDERCHRGILVVFKT